MNYKPISQSALFILFSILAGSCSQPAVTTSSKQVNPGTNTNETPTSESGASQSGPSESKSLELATGIYPISILEFLKSQNTAEYASTVDDTEIFSDDLSLWQSSNVVTAAINNGDLEAKASGLVELTKNLGGNSEKFSVHINPVKVKTFQGSSPIQSSSMDFGSIRVGGAQSAVLQIENSGEIPFEISKIKIIGKDRAEFSASGQPPKLKANNRGSFDVNFSPKSGGVKIAALLVECLIDDTNNTSKSIVLLTIRIIGFAHYKFNETPTNGGYSGSTLFGVRNGTVYQSYNDRSYVSLYTGYNNGLGSYTSVGSDFFTVSSISVDGLSTILYPSLSTYVQHPVTTTNYMISGACSFVSPRPNLSANEYLESSIETDFGFLITVNSVKPKQFTCDGVGWPGVTSFYPIRSSYRYYILKNGYTMPSPPITDSVPGRMYPAFCIKERCYFRHLDLDSNVKIISHLFEPVLTGIEITDVLGQASLGEKSIVFAKVKQSGQSTSILKVFSIVLDAQGALSATEVPWPSEYKVILESKNSLAIADAGPNLFGIVAENSFFLLQDNAGKIEISMKHVDLASAIVTAETRRNPLYQYSMDNSFDANSAKILFRIYDDFLLRQGGKFFAISSRDRKADLYPVEVPFNSKSLNDSVVADQGENTVYMRIGQDQWTQSMFKFSK